jgi:nicotinamide-nucleotide amidase
LAARNPGPKGRGRLRSGTSPRPPVRIPRPAPSEPTTAEVISVGRELLRGRTADTNAREIAAFLSLGDVVVRRITIVDDDEKAITSAVEDALARGTRLVITTGGMGPMADDRTVAAVADALRLPLAMHAHAKEMVESAYRRLHNRRLVSKNGLTAAREEMCTIPIGSEPIENAVGIAPGVFLRLAGGACVLCLPGVPAEMRSVLEAAADHLKDLVPKRAMARREVETPTADESSLRSLLDRLSLEFPSVWIKSETPGFGVEDTRIRLVFEATAPDRSQAESIVEDALRRLFSLAAGG